MSNKEKLLASAQKNLQKGQIAKAIKDYQQVIQHDPRDIRNRQKLAELLCRAGMNSEALSEYGAVAKYYADGGFYLKAIAVYKQMQKVDPEQLNIYHRLAELNVKQGLVGNALAEYRTLLAYFEKKKLFTDAVAVLQKMSELEPENLGFQVKITEYYAQAGLRDKARTEFDQLLGRLRENLDFTRMASLYEMLGPFFSGTEIKAGYAEALICKGEIEKGLSLLKNLLRDDSDNRQVLMVLTFGYREKKDFENERLTFQHLLKQAPEDLELREGYVRACLNGGEFRRAIDELEGWKEAFLDAGKMPIIKGFYERLQDALPADNLVQRALALICQQAGEETAKTPVAELDIPSTAFEAAEGELSAADRDGAFGTESEPATDLSKQEPAAPLPTILEKDQDEGSDAAEEIPLEFLQISVEAARDSLESTEGEETDTANLEVAAVMVEEMELELELEDPSVLLPKINDETADWDGGAAIEYPQPPEAELGAGTPDDLPERAGISEDRFLEKIQELEPEEILGELEPEEVLEELEPEEVLEELVAGEETLAHELRNLLSGDEQQPVGKNVPSELEEIEFYMHQGLFDDAEEACRKLLRSDPECEEIKGKLIELEQCRQAISGTPAEFQLFGYADTDGVGEKDCDASNRGVSISLDSISGSFKGDNDSQIDLEDTESHYNLGIAYKEMGLLDDALAEFDQAMKNPARLVDSLTLKGSCLLEKGEFAAAEEVFRKGLSYEHLSAGERVSLFYELGLLYEAWERLSDALDCFQSSSEIDLFFRNVGEKVEALRKTLGLDVNFGREDSGAKGNKSRVSYV